jgi:hypothetical protein
MAIVRASAEHAGVFCDIVAPRFSVDDSAFAAARAARANSRIAAGGATCVFRR